MKKNPIFYTIIAFIIVFMIYFFLFEDYIKKSELNYISSIKQEIKTLINTKKIMTLELAKTLVHNQKLIQILKTQNYDEFKKDIFSLPKEYSNFKNAEMRILNKDGIEVYSSLTYNKIGQYNLKKYLEYVFKTHIPMAKICVDEYDISFKAIYPIFDKQHTFLGIIEVITHFNSIARQLDKNQIYSAIVIDKKFSNKLLHPFNNMFIDGYNISNTNLKSIVYNILKQYKIEYFIKKSSTYISTEKYGVDGFFVTTLPIKEDNKILGYYIAFIKDKYTLAEKELILDILIIVMSILFILMTYIGYNQYKENKNLIKNLDEKVKKQTEENLSLLYIDQLTKAYKKAKFEFDANNRLGENIIVLNIRNFSKINSIYGFKIGDEVLKVLVQRIKNNLKKDIYRINADEFVIFSEDIENDIDNIRNLFIYTPIKLNSIILRLSFSFAVVKNDGKELLRKLSIALNYAKKSPFKKYVIYQDIEVEKEEFIKFNNLLYQAIFIKNKDISLTPFFQGIRNNKTGKIIKK
jgi:GGDEF domain-containing protein